MKHTSSFKKRVLGMIILMLCVSSFSVMGQLITVKGVVKDGSGMSLPGVSIRVVGSNTGTITDASGRFTIEAPAEGKLMFSYVGFNTMTIPVNHQSLLNVVLHEEEQKLNEVVVIGYGNQRKEAITGSVASVNGNALRELPASNVSDALQGRLAGVNLVQTSTQPGATMQIRIRGTRSLTASNDPLIVLDGIPFAGTIADISPDDIKSIDILKDASATAIYGSRGANGVILITTKSGMKGQKAQITYDGYYGVKNAIQYPMMNGPQFVALRKAAGIYSNGPDESDNVNTNWQSLFYRTGRVTNHDLNVSGGTENGNYMVGIGFYQDESPIPDQGYTRYSIRATVDQQIGSIFHIGFTTNNNYNVTNAANLGMYGVLSLSPISNPYNADGTIKRTVQMPLDNSWVYTRSTIENLGDAYKDQTKAFGSYNSVYGEVKIPGVEGLKYRANLGLNYRTSNYGNYTGSGVFSSTPDNVSTATITNSLTTDWAIENLLTYDRVFAQKNRLNVVALYSAEQTFYNSSNISGTGIPNNALQYYNMGDAPNITIDPNNQSYQVSGLESWMGRVMYSYDDRYMLSATFRSDASSRLAPGHKWHNYPAVSAGWNINKESFMKNISWIDELKLRGGYGQTSNQAVAPYATLGLLSTVPYNFGPTTYATGYNVSKLPNPNLGWEYSNTTNFGVDFSFFRSRLSGTIEYYVTNTKDLLMSVNLPPTSGVSSYTANVGNTQNKGWEVSLNGIILNNVNGWTWEAGVNIYGNQNRIVSLASGQNQDLTNWWFVGHPLNVIYDYKRIGLWNQTDPDYKYLQILEPGGNAGMIKVLYTGTYNADGSPTRAIGPADQQVLNCDPNFLGGFNTRVAYKGFDLVIVGIFQNGGILNSTIYGSSGYLNLLSGRRGNINVDYWTPTNTNARYPKPGGIMSGDNPKYGSTLGYFDASYLKVQAMTLGYNFNQSWLKKAGISRLRVYFTAQNPFVLFSPYHNQTGLDPETNSYANNSGNIAVAYSSNLSRLLTVGYNTPSTHNFIMGINITY
ncbi:MAG: SusC/RagA family TonB-linked outer membrane protein [Microbacter sp.]